MEPDEDEQMTGALVSVAGTTSDDAGQEPAPSARSSSTSARSRFTTPARRAIEDVSMQVRAGEITALIGPSGCGKSTFIRCLNRMNDLDRRAPSWAVRSCTTAKTCTARASTPSRFAAGSGWCSRSRTRSRSRSTTTSRSVRACNGQRKGLDDIVERALRQAALWDEVKDKLKHNAYALSGGQQQRLCIARCVAVRPDVILMDEPCSALDPIATARIEDLMAELKDEYTIVIVTHNMQQAARVSDMTAFLTADVDEAGRRVGHLVEFDATEKIFTNPSDSAHGGLHHRPVRVSERAERCWRAGERCSCSSSRSSAGGLRSVARRRSLASSARAADGRATRRAFRKDIAVDDRGRTSEAGCRRSSGAGRSDAALARRRARSGDRRHRRRRPHRP